MLCPWIATGRGDRSAPNSRRSAIGHAVIIFSEGTRTRDGHLQPAHSGVGLIVLKSNAPVVPVRVFGTFEAYGRRLRVPVQSAWR